MTKACCPDGIEARILKECSLSIEPSLCELFRSLRVNRLPTNLHRVKREKDLSVIMTENLQWNSHVYSITSKANRMLGLLRTCPFLTDVRVRRTLHLSVSFNLTYGAVMAARTLVPTHQCSKG